MEDQEETASHSLARLPPYLAFFQRHALQLQNHLKGLEENNSCRPSIIGGVKWTSSEKDAFFHALSVHSRFRPDLIAVCIETKNELQVLEYLHLLEEGSKQHGRNDIIGGMPLAHEVSDDWIFWEELNVEEWDANQKRWEATTQTGEDTNNPRLTYLKSGRLSALDSLIKKHKSSNGEQNNTMSQRDSTSVEPLAGTPSRSLNRHSQESGTQTSISSGSRISTKPSPSITARRSGDSEEASNSQALSPRSRRRLYKRMHMRRKRAQAKGVEADMSTELLRKGRKKGGVTEEVASGSRTGSKNKKDKLMQRDSEDLENGEQSFSQPNRTLDTLVDSNLDLFHLSKFGKLISLYMTGYDASPSENEGPSISIDLLCLLFEITKDFLIQVMGRVVALEEEHRRMRGTSKVWRKAKEENENVNPYAIQYALKTMGIYSENKKQYFARLLGEEGDQDDPTTSKAGYDDNDRVSNSSNILHQHPLLQDLCPPHFYINNHSEFTKHNSQDEIGLMDVDTDTEALEVELDKDEELDEADRMADKAYEKQLWKEVRPTDRDRRMLNRLKSDYMNMVT